MESLKRQWYRLPRTVRKPVILIIGSLFIIAAGLTGWLPGPGGIPLFLIGIAILATEFEWAQRVRDWALEKIHWLGQWWRKHKIVGTLTFNAVVGAFVALALLGYRLARNLL
jgi:uncharacterized protein (TIGR02611 family)